MSGRLFSLIALSGLSAAVLNVAGAEPPPAFRLERLSTATEQDLKQQLQRVSELGIFPNGVTHLTELAKGPGGLPPKAGRAYIESLAKSQGRRELAELPWRDDRDCQLGRDQGVTLDLLSKHLRKCLQAARSAGRDEPDASRLRSLLLDGAPTESNIWRRRESVPALLQLFQAEDTPVRLLLVDLLAAIDGREAAAGLANRVVFDLSPAVREAAVRALRDRRPEEFRLTLHAALRHPWTPAARHAAEALAALRDEGSVSSLIDMLDAPSPEEPTAAGDKQLVAELVRVNHLTNCVLCHAPTYDETAPARARIAVPVEKETERAADYYSPVERRGVFIRGDTTFLRQDFAVVLPIDKPGVGPERQRFDFIVRTRALTKTELMHRVMHEAPANYPQRDAVLFALRRITGQDCGSTSKNWRDWQDRRTKSLKVH